VIVLPEEHPLVLQKRRGIGREIALGRAVCCQCRMCTDLCPRHNLGHAIQPHLAMRALSASALGEVPPEHVTAAYLCCLCGLCEAYACTLGLSPRRIFGDLRARLGAAKVQSPHRRTDCAPHDFQRLRRTPLPRLVARLGLSEYAHAADLVDLRPPEVDAVRIPLRQHLGAAAVPVVRVGQRVVAGELLGEIPVGQLGARVHASISGAVTAVDERGVRIERS
jgi:Na+-translocating ferredoxin:NAD+ oxidoreductase RnfC subunit